MLYSHRWSEIFHNVDGASLEFCVVLWSDDFTLRIGIYPQLWKSPDTDSMSAFLYLGLSCSHYWYEIFHNCEEYWFAILNIFGFDEFTPSVGNFEQLWTSLDMSAIWYLFCRLHTGGVKIFTTVNSDGFEFCIVLRPCDFTPMLWIVFTTANDSDFASILFLDWGWMLLVFLICKYSFTNKWQVQSRFYMTNSSSSLLSI